MRMNGYIKFYYKVFTMDKKYAKIKITKKKNKKEGRKMISATGKTAKRQIVIIGVLMLISLVLIIGANKDDTQKQRRKLLV